MAVNTFAPSGFHEGRPLIGVSPNYMVLTRYIAFNYATPIGFGDPVILTASGTIQIYAAGGTTIDGIFLGCQFTNPNSASIPPWSMSWPGVALASGTIVQARVAVDPHATFYVQANNTTPFTQADVGKNIDLSASSPGVAGAPTLAGISTAGLAATDATTATLPFRIVGILGLNDLSGGVAISPLYNPTLGNQWLEVSMNTQDFTQTTGI